MKNQCCLCTKKPPMGRLQLNLLECPPGGRKENARSSQHLAITRDAGVAVNPLKQVYLSHVLWQVLHRRIP